MKLIAVAILLGAAIGCTSTSQIHTPAGKVGHTIGCSGGMNSWGDCYQKAGQICKEKGYTVIADGTERGAVATSSFAGTTSTRTMVIELQE